MFAVKSSACENIGDKSRRIFIYKGWWLFFRVDILTIQDHKGKKDKTILIPRPLIPKLQ